jgi:hypothetical protein
VSSRELKALLERAARFVSQHPHYGDLLRTGPESEGLGVALRRQLIEAAQQEWVSFEPSPAATGDVITEYVEAATECDGEHAHLPTWIDAQLVCYYCRRPMPSTRDANRA